MELYVPNNIEICQRIFSRKKFTQFYLIYLKLRIVMVT